MKRLHAFIRLLCYVVLFVSRISILLIIIIIMIIAGRDTKTCKFVP